MRALRCHLSTPAAVAALSLGPAAARRGKRPQLWLPLCFHAEQAPLAVGLLGAYAEETSGQTETMEITQGAGGPGRRGPGNHYGTDTHWVRIAEGGLWTNKGWVRHWATYGGPICSPQGKVGDRDASFRPRLPTCVTLSGSEHSVSTEPSCSSTS